MPEPITATELQTDLIEEILTERKRQDAKHPVGAEHDLFVMLAVIGEEAGEVNKEALDFLLTGNWQHSHRMRAELVQLAACSLKALELYDRRILCVHDDQRSPSASNQPTT